MYFSSQLTFQLSTRPDIASPQYLVVKKRCHNATHSVFQRIGTVVNNTNVSNGLTCSILADYQHDLCSLIQADYYKVTSGRSKLKLPFHFDQGLKDRYLKCKYSSTPLSWSSTISRFKHWAIINFYGLYIQKLTLCHYFFQRFIVNQVFEQAFERNQVVCL